MNLLAGTLYDPATAVNKATTALLAMTALDTTNLRLTGTVPPSGKIYWKIRTSLHGAATYPQVLLGVMNSTTVVARAPAMMAGGNLAATTICAIWAEGIITGTPGAAFTYDAAYGVETIVAATGLKYGGPNNTTANDAWGGISFELWDACPVYTPSAGAAPTSTLHVKVDTVDDFVDAEIANIQSRLPAALVSGRMDSSVGAMAADTLTASALAADTGTEIGTAVWAATTRLLTAGTNISLANGTGLTGLNDLSAAQVNAECDTALSDVGLTSAVTGRIDVAVSTRLASAGYTAPLDEVGTRSALGIASANMDAQLATIAGHIDTEVGAIKGVIDKLDTAIELDGTVYRFTTNALELAPTGSGGGLDAAGVRNALGMASADLDTQLSGISSKTTNLPSDPADASDVAGAFGTVNTTLATIAGYIDTEVGAIKAKTDNLPASPASTGDVTTVGAAVTAIDAKLGTPAGANVSADVAAVKTDAAAVKTQTDQLAITSGKVDVNVKSIAGVTVYGAGTSGDPWRP